MGRVVQVVDIEYICTLIYTALVIFSVMLGSPRFLGHDYVPLSDPRELGAG